MIKTSTNCSGDQTEMIKKTTDCSADEKEMIKSLPVAL